MAVPLVFCLGLMCLNTYLKGKEETVPIGLGFFMIYHNAFSPPGWYKCYNKLGDGCEIVFPIRMYSKVQWLPIVYEKVACDKVVPKKRSFKEVCSVWIIKTRC